MPQSYTIIKQGEDSVVSLQIFDRSGVAINLSAMPGIKAFIKVNDIEQPKRYSLTPATGEGELDVNGTVTNQVDIILERTETAAYPIGIMKAVVLVSKTDSTFSDGNKVSEYSGKIGAVQLGEGKSEVLP